MAIICRKDLSMPTGKFGAMVAHASMSFIIDRLSHKGTHHLTGDDCPLQLMVCEATFSDDEFQWLTELDTGLEEHGQVSMAKIVLAVNSEEELLEVEKSANEHNLMCCRVVDSGYSHNKPNTLTCIAIGPTWPEKLEPVTGKLKLYR